MAAGCVTVPTYTTNTERDHLHILENACAKAVFVSTPKLARTLLPAVVQSSECRTVIGFEPLRIGCSPPWSMIAMSGSTLKHAIGSSESRPSSPETPSRSEERRVGQEGVRTC